MLKLYYIIGDDKTNIDGEGYRPFIFSQDSTSVCGYVRFDTIAKRIVFIEKDYNPNDHCIGTKKIENLFCFYNCSSKICSVGYLGHFLEIISRRHRRHYTMKIVHTDPDMDTDFIAVLMFDNKLYPEKIKIYDHMSEKYIIVSAE